MRVNVFIQPETDAALSKLGGANRAQNIRRALALAECAGELAEALEWIADNYPENDPALINQTARTAIAKYKEAKQ